ncbi:outer membrane lipoprotein-sorting protein [Winogradskyella algicola]|uniref:outer membrane lipoprotein-sorting protein n=1 Tax=Winogradskyella algicola TaxID=2575815 RepID=UPI001109AA37|nr:outer membrane lipoprotein-sorting protein [Winogradskyella algicola]
MKTSFKLILALIFSLNITTFQAQTAEEIVDNYIENIGGDEAWSAVENMKITGVANQQGVDYPFVATYMKDGRYAIDVDLQGTSFIVEAFDGENSWAMNFQTQKAEASDSETSLNTKNGAQDEIVSPFHNYKDKGYTIELLGKDTWEGSEVFKVKITMTPVMVDGKEEENSEVYYFDTENFVPIASESKVTSGPAKGAMAQTLYSDYQEVDNKYVAYTMTNKFNGNTQLVMNVKSVEFNADIDESIFKMPED